MRGAVHNGAEAFHSMSKLPLTGIGLYCVVHSQTITSGRELAYHGTLAVLKGECILLKHSTSPAKKKTTELISFHRRPPHERPPGLRDVGNLFFAPERGG